jgi:uncharacterized protein YjbI with pentapeptide repeats
LRLELELIANERSLITHQEKIQLYKSFLLRGTEMDATEMLRLYAAGRRDFQETNLSDARLNGVNLSGINLSGVTLIGASYKAILDETDLTSTCMTPQCQMA